MNDYALWLKDNNAWFSRADRFDGFDRGDRPGMDDEARDAENEELLRKMLAEGALAGGAA